MEQLEEIRLTKYSHGAGCGCKISPTVLDIILKNNEAFGLSNNHPQLIVGNNSRDDAAVYDLGNGKALISTTDFFMPIVDDPFDFGRIASANAISDVYAMGGNPILAIAILGWPIEKLSPEIAQRVIEGSRYTCAEAGIPLAGGHSIDSPEPIFGLAVNGIVEINNLKRNNTAKEGDILFLTKKLGVGILSTASKKGVLSDIDREALINNMVALNKIGSKLGKLEGVNALTDVTGFALLGHLIEMCEGSGVSAEINFSDLAFLDNVDTYIGDNCVPGGTQRNWKSYGEKVLLSRESMKQLLCDPQTSGGLLVAVNPSIQNDFIQLLEQENIATVLRKPIGRIISKREKFVYVLE